MGWVLCFSGGKQVQNENRMLCLCLCLCMCFKSPEQHWPQHGPVRGSWSSSSGKVSISQAPGSSAGLKSLDELPARLRHLLMRLMRFSYTISHLVDKDIATADVLSRAPVSNTSRGAARGRHQIVCCLGHSKPASYRKET